MKASGALAALALALALASCGPVYEGPQLAEVPDGLAYTSSIRSARVPLPGRRVLAQYAYAGPGGLDWKTSVVISEYEGLATRSEVEAARDGFHARYGGRSSRYGPVGEVRVGGRPGWGYTEDGLLDGRVVRRGLTAVVPWDERTFSLEVGSSEAPWDDREAQRRLVASFHVAKRGRYRPLLFGLLLAGLCAWALLGRRFRGA